MQQEHWGRQGSTGEAVALSLLAVGDVTAGSGLCVTVGLWRGRRSSSPCLRESRQAAAAPQKLPHREWGFQMRWAWCSVRSSLTSSRHWYSVGSAASSLDAGSSLQGGVETYLIEVVELEFDDLKSWQSSVILILGVGAGSSCKVAM